MHGPARCSPAAPPTSVLVVSLVHANHVGGDAAALGGGRDQHLEGARVRGWGAGVCFREACMQGRGKAGAQDGCTRAPACCTAPLQLHAAPAAPADWLAAHPGRPPEQAACAAHLLGTSLNVLARASLVNEHTGALNHLQPPVGQQRKPWSITHAGWAGLGAVQPGGGAARCCYAAPLLLHGIQCWSGA